MTNSVCNYGQDSTRPPGPATDRYGDAHTSRFVRPLAGRATLISIDELVLVAQNVRAGAAAASVVGFLPLAASNGGARPREPVAVRRRGRSACCGGPGRQWDAACGVDRTRSRHRDRCNDNPPPERGTRAAGTRRGPTRPDELQREQLTGRRQKGRIDTWRTGSPTGARTRRSSWP